MSRILITTLGKGQPPKDNREAIHGNYQTAQYRFEDGTPSEPTQFFGLALYRHLVETGWEPDKIVVLGTSTSMWDAWLESAPELAEQADFADRLYDLQKPGNNGVGEDDPTLLSEILSNHYKATFDCRLIPFGRTAEEQTDVLRILAGTVGRGDELVLDVTHGFRHLPMLEMLSSFLLRHVKNVGTKAIYYGALDMPGRDGVKPVVRLDALSRLHAWAEAVAVLEKTGNVLPLAALKDLPGGPEAKKRLERYQFYQEMNALFPMRSTAGEISRWINESAESDVLHLFGSALRDFFSWHSLPPGRGQLELARRAFSRGNLAQSVLQLFEAVITLRMPTGSTPTNFPARMATEKELSDSQDQSWWLLKDLRNAIAHGTFTDSSRHKLVINAMRDNPDRFQKEMKSLFRWAEETIDR